ncbi:MAG TPA: glycosyltransferase family 2 protein [Acetobacteraceae bacterium]|nr:glycosyltransferase family 2 protein [Acetobacteraceae bacterium]
MDKKKLVACAIFENAAPGLPEWLAYHRVVGVEHFVLYDNGSSDDPARAIRNSPLAEHVTLIHWPQRPGQVAAYRHFIDIFAPGFEWAAFLDLDEFLLPLNGRNVVDTLDWLSNASAVLVHRRVFGIAQPRDPPPGLVIETYDRRAADNFPAHRHARTIVRCNELLDVTQNPHEFRVNGPVFNTAGHLAPNSAIQDQPCYQNLVINHYYARSRPDALAKLQSQATAGAATAKGEPGVSDLLAALCQVQDTAIQAFAPAVRQLLGQAPVATPAPEASDPGPVALASVAPVTVAPVSVPESVAAAVAAAFMAHAPDSPAARPEPPPLPDVVVLAPVEGAATWLARGPDARERAGGLGLVFRDRSRPGEHWLAALRGGAAVATIDPAFLRDEFDRIRDFPTDGEARAACDSALAQTQGR